MKRRNFLQSAIAAAVSFAVPVIALAKPKSLRHPDAKYRVERVGLTVNTWGNRIAVPIDVFETFEDGRKFVHSIPRPALMPHASGLFWISDSAERVAAMSDDEFIDMVLQRTKNGSKHTWRVEDYFDFDKSYSIHRIS